MLRRVGLIAAASAAICACGASTGPAPARWREAIHLRGVVDLTPPRSDGRRVVAAAGRLWLIRRGGAPTPFAAGYRAPANADEPYIALATGAGCFARDGIYALAPGARPAVVRVDRRGHTRRFATLPGGWFLDGIAFDQTGDFGLRLLVTATKAAGGRLFAIDCHGAVAAVARRIPKVEGGLAVAPRTFGRFGGDLIAPDENSGRIYAIDRRGRARLLARPGLPHGGDIGVESAGFVPSLPATAHLADRGTPGNPHPGTDSVLTLTAALVQRGDLLVATEGGAETIAIHCASRCTVRHIADGPAVAHAEGHISF